MTLLCKHCAVLSFRPRVLLATPTTPQCSLLGIKVKMFCKTHALVLLFQTFTQTVESSQRQGSHFCSHEVHSVPSPPLVLPHPREDSPPPLPRGLPPSDGPPPPLGDCITDVNAHCGAQKLRPKTKSQRMWERAREVDTIVLLWLWLSGLQKGMKRALERPLLMRVDSRPLHGPSRG